MKYIYIPEHSNLFFIHLQYQVGQLHAIVEASRENTTGDTGVEILANEPFDNERGSGQYTHKVYHMGSKVPGIVSVLLPSSSLLLVEKAWNAFPHCRTEFSNPFLKDRFQIVVESRHINDAGITENAFCLKNDELQRRKIIWVDIAADPVSDNPPHLEPSKFLSEKTKRGNLSGEWWEKSAPIMCCYKLVTIKFQVFGLQTQNQRELLTRFHKHVFCSIDKWYGLTMEDIRILEDQIKQELDDKICTLGLAAAKEGAGSTKSTPY